MRLLTTGHLGSSVCSLRVSQRGCRCRSCLTQKTRTREEPSARNLRDHPPRPRRSAGAAQVRTPSHRVVWVEVVPDHRPLVEVRNPLSGCPARDVGGSGVLQTRGPKPVRHLVGCLPLISGKPDPSAVKASCRRCSEGIWAPPPDWRPPVSRLVSGLVIELLCISCLLSENGVENLN